MCFRRPVYQRKKHVRKITVKVKGITLHIKSKMRKAMEPSKRVLNPCRPEEMVLYQRRPHIASQKTWTSPPLYSQENFLFYCHISNCVRLGILLCWSVVINRAYLCQKILYIHITNIKDGLIYLEPGKFNPWNSRPRNSYVGRTSYRRIMKLCIPQLRLPRYSTFSPAVASFEPWTKVLSKSWIIF